MESEPLDTVRIRNMKREELPVAVEWAVAEGWNPGIANAECFWLENSAGFFCTEAGAAIPCRCRWTRSSA